MKATDEMAAVKKPRKASSKLPAKKAQAPLFKKGAGKTAVKKSKQLSGFQAIAKRKAARAKAAGKTYDMAKSNPRLAKKIAGKKAAIAKTGVMVDPVLKNPPKKRKTKKTSF